MSPFIRTISFPPVFESPFYRQAFVCSCVLCHPEIKISIIYPITNDDSFHICFGIFVLIINCKVLIKPRGNRIVGGRFGLCPTANKYIILHGVLFRTGIFNKVPLHIPQYIAFRREQFICFRKFGIIFIYFFKNTLFHRFFIRIQQEPIFPSCCNVTM